MYYVVGAVKMYIKHYTMEWASTGGGGGRDIFN